MVSGDLAIFNKIKMGKRRRWNLLKALFTGKLKIKARLTGLIGLLNILWVFEDLFSKKMS